MKVFVLIANLLGLALAGILDKAVHQHMNHMHEAHDMDPNEQADLKHERCQRSKIERHFQLPGKMATTIGDISVIHLPKAAFIEDVCMEDSNTNKHCVKKSADPRKITYGWDRTQPFVWVKGNCSGEFIIRFAVAYHYNASCNSLLNKKHFTANTPKRPCKGDTRIYSITVDKEVDRDNLCRNRDMWHTGTGDRFGFFNRTIWTDRGCSARFRICEVSIDHDLDEEMTSLPGHGGSHMKRHKLKDEKMAGGMKMESGMKMAGGKKMADGMKMAGGKKMADGMKMAGGMKMADGMKMTGGMKMADGMKMAGGMKMADGMKMAGGMKMDHGHH